MLWVLVGLNVAVYVAWHLAFRAPVDLFERLMAAVFLVSADAVLGGYVWTLVTHAFSHVDSTHLFVNVLALWVFGRDVARLVGTRAFLRLYLAGALFAGLGHVLYGLVTGDVAPALGASGSVMAIAVVYAALFPRRTLLVGFFLPLPAALAVAAYVLLDAAGMFGGTTSRVAHAAHLGGAAYGLAYWYLRIRPRLAAVSTGSRSPRPPTS